MTIIVPFWNVEKYFEQCLDSIVQSTRGDIEVLLIDDCGQDGSLDIAQRFAQVDSRLRIISHATNKKQGGARNTGIREAKGDYIWFVDSDDWLSVGAIDNLLAVCSVCASDVVLFDSLRIHQKYGYNSLFCYVGDRDNLLFERQVIQELQKTVMVFDNPTQIEKLLIGGMSPEFGGVTSLIYKREFLLQNKFFFAENIVYEDVITFLWLTKCDKIVYCLDKPYYNYRIRAGSTMTKSKLDTQYLINAEIAKQVIAYKKDCSLQNYIALVCIFGMIFDRNAPFLRTKQRKTAIVQAVELLTQAKLHLTFDTHMVYNSLIASKFDDKRASAFARVFCDTKVPTSMLQKHMLKKMKADKLRCLIKSLTPSLVLKQLKKRRDNLTTNNQVSQ